jgi:hypothetical protein
VVYTFTRGLEEGDWGEGELKREWIVKGGTKEAYYIAEIAEICNLT